MLIARGTRWKIAARTGDRALFDRYRDGFEKAQVPAERARYLRALGAFRNPELMDAALASRPGS